MADMVLAEHQSSQRRFSTAIAQGRVKILADQPDAGNVAVGEARRSAIIAKILLRIEFILTRVENTLGDFGVEGHQRAIGVCKVG
ncbi:hypothetical protein [Xanthobacter sp. ZOL 2024]